MGTNIMISLDDSASAAFLMGTSHAKEQYQQHQQQPSGSSKGSAALVSAAQGQASNPIDEFIRVLESFKGTNSKHMHTYSPSSLLSPLSLSVPSLSTTGLSRDRKSADYALRKRMIVRASLQGIRYALLCTALTYL
jgi:hypothetical protein